MDEIDRILQTLKLLLEIAEKSEEESHEWEEKYNRGYSAGVKNSITILRQIYKKAYDESNT